MTYVLILLLHATPWSFTTKRHGPLEAGASEPSLCARLCSSHIGATHIVCVRVASWLRQLLQCGQGEVRRLLSQRFCQRCSC